MKQEAKQKAIQEAYGDNNGWIKIESEKDLPKESCTCIIIDRQQEEYIYGTFRTLEQDKEYWLENATHYQPIVKPKPPIY